MKKIIALITVTLLIIAGMGYYLVKPYLPEKQIANQTAVINDKFTMEEDTVKCSNPQEPFIQITFPKTVELNRNITLTANTKEKYVSYIWELDYEGSRVQFSSENKITIKMNKHGKYSIYVSMQNMNGDTMSEVVKYTDTGLQ